MPAGDPGVFKIHAMHCHRLFTATGHKKIGKINCQVFRVIAKACPPALGRFDEESDSLIVEMPVVFEDVHKMALKSFCRMTPDTWKTAVTLKQAQNRGGPHRNRASQSR